MPIRQISNPGGVWGATAQAEQVTLEVINNAATTLTQGDVVIIDATGTLVTTTTTANDKRVLGVVTTTKDASVDATPIAIGAPCQVVVSGVARIQIGAGTVAISDILGSTTTAKTAVTNNAATVGQAIAIALEAQTAKDVNNCIRAIIGKM
jgi:hypothetical protein